MSRGGAQPPLDPPVTTPLATIAIRLASRRFRTHLQIDKLLNKESQSQTRPSVAAAADASLKMKSSNRARGHLTLIGRKTDRNRNANDKLYRQCDSALTRYVADNFLKEYFN